MKKILIILVLLLTICFVSCNNNSPKETYNITYIVDNKQVDLLPNTYTAGSSVILPEGYNWFINPSLTIKATNISENDTEDKIFYASSIKDEPVTDPNDKDDNLFLNANKYQYEVISDDVTTTYKYQHNIDQDKFMLTYNYFGVIVTSFISYDNNLENGKYLYESGIKYAERSFDKFYESDLVKYDFLCLCALKEEDFNIVDDTYIVKNNILDDVYYKIFKKPTSDLSSIILKVTDKTIKEVVITTNEKTSIYEIKQLDENIIIPKNESKASYKLNQMIKINTLNDQNPNNLVYTKGTVKGFSGYNFIIGDETGNIYCYCYYDYRYGLKAGDEIFVEGTVSAYNGLLQLIPNRVYSLSNSNQVTSTDINNYEDLEKNISNLVNIKNVILKEKPVNLSSDTDNIFVVEIDGHDVKLFIKKKIVNITTYLGFLNNLDIGDTFSLNDVTVSIYNEIQISMLNYSTLTK